MAKTRIRNRHWQKSRGSIEEIRLTLLLVHRPKPAHRTVRSCKDETDTNDKVLYPLTSYADGPRAIRKSNTSYVRLQF